MCSIMDQPQHNHIFIDLQGFRDNYNKFVVKEFCYIFGNSNTPNHFIFKPPFNWPELTSNLQRSVYYLTQHHHGFRWSDGELEYKHVQTCLNMMLMNDNIQNIYVKGEEKIKWLRELCSYLNAQLLSNIDIIDIIDVDFMPSLNNVEFKKCVNQPDCGKHNNIVNVTLKQCALQNALILKHYYKNNIEKFY